MTFIVATNAIAIRPTERRPTGTPHARANIFTLTNILLGAPLAINHVYKVFWDIYVYKKLLCVTSTFLPSFTKKQKHISQTFLNS